MVEQAMKDATSEGGRFFGMMEKQSKTALGQWSTFQDNLNMLLAEFGKIILPTAIKGLQKLSSMLEWFNSLSTGTKKTILIF
jgi:TP901 family phage tail tape measure protein